MLGVIFYVPLLAMMVNILTIAVLDVILLVIATARFKRSRLIVLK